MKLLGSILLTIGFLAGAFFSVSEAASVDWRFYGACLGVMLFGMIFLRMARSQELEQSGEKHASDIAVLQQSLASVIAKVTRDRIMADLALQHPGYGWETNKGYGTAAHQDGLERLGVTPHHRRSFRPIHNILG